MKTVLAFSTVLILSGVVYPAGAVTGTLTNELYNASVSGGPNNESSLAVGTSDAIEGLMPLNTNYSGTFEAAGGSIGVLTDGQTAASPSNFGNPALNPNEGTNNLNAAFDCVSCAGGTGNWYAEYDLTNPATISNVVVTTGHQDNRTNQQYDILLSNDGTNFLSLSDGTTQTIGNAGTGFSYLPGAGGAAQSTVSPSSGSDFGSYRYVEFVALAGGSDVFRELDVNTSAVPEPSTWLAAGGLVLLAAGDFRRRLKA